jgi:PAS domain S-box-containing protein
MNDKEQHEDELASLRLRIAELESLRASQKQIAEAIRENERRYRALVRSMTDVIFTVDENWNFTFLSPEFKEITGYNVEDLIWHPFVEILAPECAEAFLDNFGYGTHDKVDVYHEIKVIHRDGSEVPVELSTTPILDVGGQPTGIILGAVRDLTERKRIEEEFIRTQKFESIGVLAGGIAHDFNNILTVILANVSLAKIHLESGEPKDNTIEILTKTEEASMQAKNLTQQLLGFSRYAEPVKEVISIAGVLKDSADLALSGSKSKCELSIPDDLWLVEADEGQISQVINNIIINADQAMPEGGVVSLCAENVKVGLEDDLPLEDGKYVKISIEDQGVGIPEENLQRIFDPYFTTKRKHSGLGLTTSYFIVKKHEGHIVAESQVGNGTAFNIYLPAASEKSLSKSELLKEEVKAKPDIGKKRLLVMDDDASIRLISSQILSKVGHEVDTAMDGTEAVSLYEEAKVSGRSYDAVILDLTVPGGAGGEEVMQKLKEIDPKVKVIATSGYSKHRIATDFRKYGFKGFVAKPYRIEDLLNALYDVVMGKDN